MYIQVDSRVSSKILVDFKHVLDINQELKGEYVLFCSFSGFDIPIGTIFEKVIAPGRNNATIVPNCRVELVKVSQQYRLPFDIIPMGYKTIAKFRFSDQVIPFLAELPISNHWIFDNPNSLQFHIHDNRSKIKDLLSENDSKMIAHSEIYEVNLDGKKYYHIADLGDGDFIGINEQKILVKVTHFPFSITEFNGSLGELLASRNGS